VPETTGERTAVCPFMSDDRRKLSEIAEDICEGLITDGVWRAPADQQRRIVGSFVWITGDKPIGDYRQEDASSFKRSLQKLPVKFRWKHDPGVRFLDVLTGQPAITDLTRRSDKTVNRDLSTMSSFYEAMRTAGHWKPVIETSKVLNFASLQDAIIEDLEAPPRVPWQERHLREIFGSPIFHGNQGAKKRLKSGSSIAQDSAYWGPILLYWTLAARDEIGGLELNDIFLGEAIPYFFVRKNSTRDLKRNARKRRLPIAGEILRLGFSSYVAALKATGAEHLFPELYINKKKVGGAQFYAICWVYLINWLADRSDIPASEAGKEADIHSMRTFGGSILDTSTQVNQNVVKDIMGHARQGVTAKSYQKRKLVLGEQATLQEMLEVIERHLPAVTEDIPSSPLCLLPLDQRSRCGSARPRKVRTAKQAIEGEKQPKDS
jgi:integrase